jgi:hypothetical protein
VKSEIGLCKELGIPVRDLDIMDIHLAGGAIQKRLRELRTAGIVNLNAAQQAELRQAAYAAIVPKLKGK